MKGRKKAKLSLGVVLVFAVNFLSNMSATIAFAQNNNDAIKLNATDVTEEISDEDKMSIFEEALDKNKVEEYNIDNPDEEVWVIVQMEEKSLIERIAEGLVNSKIGEFANSSEGKALSQKLLNEQSNLKNDIATKGISAEYKHSYTVALNGFAAKVKNSDIEAIKKLSNVKEVIKSTYYYVDDENANNGQEGIIGEAAESNSEEVDESESAEQQRDTITIEEPQVEETIENNEEVTINQDSGEEEIGLMSDDMIHQYTGSGMVVAVVDTGLDYTHSAFQIAPVSPALSKDNIQSVLDNTYAYSAVGCGIDEVYYSLKLPFMFDYADLDSNVAPTEESVEKYGNDHGTHVAGIVAGNDEEITGVSPDAQLAIMKVFSDGSSGAATVDILAGLNDALVIGADVINMSLGSSGGFSSEESDSLISKIYDSIDRSGINLVTSAGNAYSSTYGGSNGEFSLTSNPDTGVVGSPSSYDAAFSVASIDSEKAKYIEASGNYLRYNEIGGHIFADELANPSYEYVVIPGSGLPEDYAGIDLAGKIAVVKRGKTSFTDKQLTAAEAGAIGCIIYNNRDGYLLNMSITDYKIPTIAISLASGEILENAENKVINIPQDYDSEKLMSDFSSWGPLPSLELKPEITAPGGNVYSSLPFQTYGYMSGTSMSSPWIAGASAIVKQYVESSKSLSEKDTQTLVNRLLMSTAVPVKDEDGIYYSPRKQGSGVADINAAINTPAYIYVYGQDRPKLDLGDDKDEKGVYELSFRVKNMTNSTLSYDLTANAMTESVKEDGKTIAQKAHPFDNAIVEITDAKNGSVEGSTVIVGANKDVSITVKITLTEEDKAYMKDRFENGIYVEGYAMLKSNDEEGTDLTIPYLSFFGDWTEAPILDSNYYDEKEADLFDSYVTGVYGLSLYRLGTYLFNLPEGLEEPKPSVDKIAVGLNRGNGIGNIGYVALGLLRGAKEIDYKITDKATGRVVSETTDINARKAVYNSSRGAIYQWNGGSIYPDLYDSGSEDNNTELIYSMNAMLDYKDTQNNKNSTWEFPVYIDYEYPNLENRNNLKIYEKDGHTYLDVELSDNRYLSAVTLYSYTEGYNNYGEWVSRPGSNYYSAVTPINEIEPYETSKTTFDITDFKDSFNNNRFYIIAWDYALNEATYLIELPTVATTGISINKNEATMKINETLNLTATVAPEDATNKNVSWQSSDEKVAVVKDGQVTSVSEGTAIIKAITEDGGFEAECKITVTSEVGNPIEVSRVTLDSNSLSLYQGESTVLTAKVEPGNATDKTIKWESSDESIATVDNGTVKAVSPGEAKITATAVNEVAAECKVTVSPSKEAFEIVDNVLVAYNGFEENVVIPEGVTAIGDGAFKKNTTIKSVVIPNSVKVIGNEGFRECSNLTAVQMPETLDTLGEYVFYNCNSLQSMDLPKGLQRIEKYALGLCKSMTSVTIPDTVTFIGPNAFYNCAALEEISIPDSVTELGTTTYGAQNFSNCASLKTVNLSKNIKVLPQSSFLGCTSLESIDLSNIEVISKYAFQNTGFKELTIPANVTEVGSRAFATCKKLTSINFAGSPILADSIFYDSDSLVQVTGNISEITSQMFKNCEGLTSFEVPASVVKINDSAFDMCKNLTEVLFSKDSVFKAESGSFGIKVFNGCNQFTAFKVEEGNENLKAVDGVLYDKEQKFLLSAPTVCTVTELNIPNTVEIINDYAFYKHTEIKSINFSDSLVKVGSYAFYGDVNLETMNFKDGLKEIGAYAFYGANSKLQSIILPDTTESIGDYAFYGYTAAKTIHIGNNVENIGTNAFYNCKVASVIELSERLKSIGTRAFYGCSAVENITLPQGLESIGDYAFYNCYKLKAIEMPDTITTIGTYCFYNARSLGSLKLSNSLETLPKYAFAYLNYSYSYYTDGEPIRVIDIPANIKYIEVSAFNSCNYLERFNVDSANQDYSNTEEGILMDLATNSIYIWPSANKTEEFTIPSNMTAISSKMLQNNKGIKKIIVPGTVNSVGDYAFSSSSLEEIVFEDSTNGGLTFGRYVFYNCKDLNKVSLPNGLTEVGDYTFQNCEGLESIKLPDTLVSTGYGTFRNCTTLNNVELSARLTAISGETFYGCSTLEVVNLPASVSSIANMSSRMPFTGCTSLKEINVDENSRSYQSIDGVLYDKEGLELELYPVCKEGEDYSIPEGVTRINKNAFLNNLNLKSVTLPASLQRIGDMAFRGCYNLKTYNFNSMEAPLLEVGSYLPLFNLAWYGNFYDVYFTWDSDFNMTYTDMDIEMYYPENATGYNGKLYNIFFATKTEETAENMLSVGNLNAELAESGAVELSWNEAKWGKGYKVERALISDKYVEVTDMESNEEVQILVNDIGEFEEIADLTDTKYSDENVVFGKTYMYRVKAYDENGTYGSGSTAAVYINAVSEDQQAALTVIRMIQEIDEPITVESKVVINEVRNAYDALTESQQSLVYNYEDLLSAESQLKAAEQEEADKEVAKVVIRMIDELPVEVTRDATEAIEAARDAYDALSEHQKELVTNYDKLLEKEEELYDAYPLLKLRKRLKDLFKGFNGSINPRP